MPDKAQIDQITDQDLVKDLRLGDQDAFELLYDKYGRAIFGLLCKITNHPALAEDLLHQCFVKVWQDISLFDPQQQRLFTWICTMARTLGQDKMSVKNDLDQIQAGKNYVKESIAYAQEKKPEQIFDLVFIKGKTYEELEKEMGITREELKRIIRSEINLLRK